MGILDHHFSHFVTKEPKPDIASQSRQSLEYIVLGSVTKTMLLGFPRSQTAMYQVISYSQVGMCMCVSESLAD